MFLGQTDVPEFSHGTPTCKCIEYFANSPEDTYSVSVTSSSSSSSPRPLNKNTL